MTDSNHTLRRILVARGLIDPVAPWQRLQGGRTNRLWRVGHGRNSLVCKLFSSAGSSPLFPNEPEAEANALKSLSGTGIAPDFLAAVETQFGQCLLYRFVEGPTWNGDWVSAAELLAKLHARGRISQVSVAPSMVDTETQLLANLRSTDRQAFMDACPPRPQSTAEVTLIHGDPVPANIVMSTSGPVLIDWQCPQIGDPAQDIAIFLSPAMQSLYGGFKVSPHNLTQFLNAYGDPDISARYLEFRPYYHWRMALHCAWKLRNGDAEYGAAMALELQALQECA